MHRQLTDLEETHAKVIVRTYMDSGTLVLIFFDETYIEFEVEERYGERNLKVTKTPTDMYVLKNLKLCSDAEYEEYQRKRQREYEEATHKRELAELERLKKKLGVP